MTFTVPGTPEQIWNAIATGPGLSAWFARTDLEPREGGKIALHLGGDVISKATITAYHPLQRFAYVEHDWEPGAPPLATVFTIETGGNDDEPCKVHVAQTVGSDSGPWTDQLASMEGGWTAMFGVLDLYLTDFAGDQPFASAPLSRSPGISMPRPPGLRPPSPATMPRPSCASPPPLPTATLYSG